MIEIKRKNVCPSLVAALSVVFVLTCFAENGWALSDKFALMVKKSPTFGGVVSPEGIFESPDGEEIVRVTAKPLEGVEFVYWLGDVADPRSRNTTVYLDSAKMVVAVFERVEIEAPSQSGDGRKFMGSTAAGSSGNGLFAVPGRIHGPRGSGMSGGGGSPPSNSTPTTIIDDSEVPEPATVLLLAGGAALVRKRKKQKKRG